MIGKTQIVVFLGILIGTALILPGIVNAHVDSALIQGNIEEKTFSKGDLTYNNYYHSYDETHMPMKDTDGSVLYDLYFSKSYTPDTFELFINGSAKGITTLDVAKYIPKDSVSLSYTTLLFAMKLYYPGGVPIIQFIRLVDYGYDYYFENLGTEEGNSFPPIKNYNTIQNDSEGNIVDDVISWITDKVYGIIDKSDSLWISRNSWGIGILAGLVVFIPGFPKPFG